MAKGHIENTNDRIYYVYAWYIKSTNEVFHVGKGKNNRYLDIKTHRNQYFINVVSKHKYLSTLEIYSVLRNKDLSK